RGGPAVALLRPPAQPGEDTGRGRRQARRACENKSEEAYCKEGSGETQGEAIAKLRRSKRLVGSAGLKRAAAVLDGERLERRHLAVTDADIIDSPQLGFPNIPSDIAQHIAPIAVFAETNVRVLGQRRGEHRGVGA